MPRWSHGLQETIAIRIWRILLQEVRTDKKREDPIAQPLVFGGLLMVFACARSEHLKPWVFPMKNGGFQFLNVSRKKQSAEKPLRVVSKTFRTSSSGNAPAFSHPKEFLPGFSWHLRLRMMGVRRRWTSRKTEPTSEACRESPSCFTIHETTQCGRHHN